MLRDFIYLDWERVRSLAAQLFEGLPETSTAERGHDVGAKGNVEGGLLGILKGEAGADYRYFRHQNETRSFHHHVYTLVEDKLTDDGAITTIDHGFDFTKWAPGFLRDGQFVRVTGVVRLMDYSWVSTMLEAVPKMARVVHRAEMIDLKQKRASNEISEKQLQDKRKEHDRTMEQLNQLKIEETTGMIRQLYGDVVRVKVVPNTDLPEKILVGTGALENFHDTAASLSQKYGYSIDADWVTLGQINSSSTRAAEPKPIPIGNAMEDGFEQVALLVNKMICVASAPSFPAVSFTPISIYRRIDS